MEQPEHRLVFVDFTESTRDLGAEEVIKVIVDNGAKFRRVWIQLHPGFEMIEARNADTVYTWGSRQDILEDF